MTFKRSCPSCRAKDKIILRCKKCYELKCSQCSILGLCIDCYIAINGEEEVKIYFADKLNTVIPT